MTSASSSAAAPRPAATVVVLRDHDVARDVALAISGAPEIFMVRRREGSAFMGGAFVFPGGRVEDADLELARHAREISDAEFCVAAARELFEEAGVLLARDERGHLTSLDDAAAQRRFRQHRVDVHAGRESFAAILARERLELALDLLVPFAHWVTPPVDARRFDTRFFLARVPPNQAAVHDATETTESAWMTAADAIARGRRDEIVLPPPTWTTLRELEAFGTVDEALAWARGRRIQRREPKFVDENGVKMLLLPGDPRNPEAWGEPLPRETRFVLANGRWRAEGPRA